MNPFGLDATGLMVWGLVAHLIVDWLFQNDWMATRKADHWWTAKSPAEMVKRGAPGLTHAGLHFVALALIFGYWPGLALGTAHYLIDLRTPVAWWSRLIRQTQPTGIHSCPITNADSVPVVDIGMFVRFWNDQVWHIACIAIAALVVGGLA